MFPAFNLSLIKIPNGTIIKMLVDVKGIEINVIDDTGRTALHDVASKCPALIPILVENGIDINAKTHGGKSAL